MTIQGTYEPPEGARRSDLWITCTHHPAEQLLDIFTFDGETAFYYGPQTMHEEYVSSWQPTAEERAKMESRPLRFNYPTRALDEEGSPRPDIEGHWRLTLKCPRPSCPYRPELTEVQKAKAEMMLYGMWHNEIAALTLADLDTLLARRFTGIEGL